MIRQTKSGIALSPVIWLTGVSGSGKSTLALLLCDALRPNRSVALLDGDSVRDFFEGDLGYTRAERIANVRRITFAAKLLAEHGTTVVVANIAPYYEVRDFIRRKIPHYIQVFLDASVEMVKARDVKRLYAHRQAEQVTDVIGIDEVYDRPRNPDLTINTDTTSEADSLRLIWDLLQGRGLLSD